MKTMKKPEHRCKAFISDTGKDFRCEACGEPEKEGKSSVAVTSNEDRIRINAIPDNSLPSERLCRHCGGLIKIRNPTGCCDHLYYPENCDVCRQLFEKPEPEKENKLLTREQESMTGDSIVSREAELHTENSGLKKWTGFDIESEITRLEELKDRDEIARFGYLTEFLRVADVRKVLDGMIREWEAWRDYDRKSEVKKSVTIRDLKKIRARLGL